MKTNALRIASAALVAALAPGLAVAQTCTPDARRVVDAVYRQVLERGANGEGGTAVTQLGNGQTSVRELVRSLAHSQEHIGRFMSGAHNADVTYAYRHLLGREPDPTGLEGYVNALKSVSPTAVVDDIMSSAEYQQAFGDDVVPGARLRYCGAAAATSQNRLRFPNMDRNGNMQIERDEWNGNRGSFDVHDWNGDGVLAGEEVQIGGRRAPRAVDNDFDPAGPATWTAQNFRLLDRNRDNQISSNEWSYGTQSFRRADRDRSGALTAAEFTDEGYTAAGSADDREVRFDTMDGNRNGRIEAREWTGTADAFQWLDRNNDNWLSRAEVVGEQTTATATPVDGFATLDANRNTALEPAEWRWSLRSFNRYDTNGDGRVTRQEFTAGGGTPTTP